MKESFSRKICKGVFEFYLETFRVCPPPYNCQNFLWRASGCPWLEFPTCYKLFYIMPDRYKHHPMHVDLAVPLFSQREEFEHRIPILPGDDLSVLFAHRYIDIENHSFFIRNNYGILKLRQSPWIILNKLWLERGGIFHYEDVWEALVKVQETTYKIVPMKIEEES